MEKGERNISTGEDEKESFLCTLSRLEEGFHAIIKSRLPNVRGKGLPGTGNPGSASKGVSQKRSGGPGRKCIEARVEGKRANGPKAAYCTLFHGAVSEEEREQGRNE